MALADSQGSLFICVCREIMNQSEIKKLHNGLIKCPLDKYLRWMPQIKPLIDTAPIPHKDYVIDAKVHMLMPNQYPCIPNWHCDAVPRDENKNQQWDKVNLQEKMFLWLSGPPFTEFKDSRLVEAQKWIEFDQSDEHRGTISQKHQWRLFIRLMPKSFVQRHREGAEVLRRHTQVYLDAKDFTW